MEAIRAGFVGLGDIGRPMAERLVGGGVDTTVFDLRPEPCAALATLGARVAGSVPALAAAVDVLGVCVRDDAQVRRVVLGADGAIAAARPGTVIALHSTILPRTVREVARAAAARDVAVVDAPITGGSGGARSGTLTFMVGGAAAAVERCRPLFATSAAHIVHTGELGSGATTKLCNNLILYLGFLAVSEALALSRAAGLSLDALQEVTRAAGVMTDGMAAFARMRAQIDERPDDPSLQARADNFADLAEKDLAVTLAFAAEHGLELPGAARCREIIGRVYGRRERGTG